MKNLKNKIMKKTIFIVVVSVITAIGCQDNFLDTSPSDSLGETNFWQNEDHALSGITGIYHNLTYNHVYKRYHQRDAMTPYVYSDDRFAGFNLGIISNRDGLFSNSWNELYRGVQRANDALSRLPDVPDLDEAIRTRLVAEAKFLRALHYFNLLDVFGGVPIYDEPVPIREAYKPRSSAADVRAFIISDLNDAISGLPDPGSLSSSEHGRATTGAAIALRGKVYLYNEQWSEAESDFNTVMNLGYELHPDYGTLFTEEYEASSEYIFSVQYIEDDGVGNELQWNLGTGSHPPGNNWANFVASNILVDTYENIDGSDFDWEDIVPGFNSMSVQEKDVVFLMDNLSESQRNQYLSTSELEDLYIEGGNEDRIKQAWEDRDPRMQATIILPYTSFVGINGIEWTRRHPGRNFTAPEYDVISRPGALHFFKKFVVNDELADRVWGPIDFPVIRYADVLLMFAEARNENTGLDEQVLNAINEVRQRAGIAELQNTNPSEPTYVANTDEMRERIRRERAVEFVLEGTYYSDIRRWDIGDEVNNHEIQFFNGAPVRTRQWPSHYNLWPIPPNEIDNNPDLTQNPGWE